MHRRWGLQNFLGLKKNYYDLVVPKETKLEGKLNQFFRDKRVLPVKVSIEKNHGEESIEVSKVKRWF
ncbi:hypothetical protein ACNVED_16055 (plasmid) [Legionella sp. D16C41]|uniref:hypothetical protein n=1 Tax=Legionella sp. D16C41 TaxID=3402688 RepID=UPI003AF8CD68